MSRRKSLVLLIIFVLLLNVFFTNAIADSSGLNWYLIKNKNGGTPCFPEETAFIEKNNGYFIDKKANKENDKVLYLTFDTGFENGNVEKTLDILKNNDVCSAFFILSNIIRKNPDLIKRMAEEGHLVCNHTKNHKDMTTLTDEEVILNLKYLEDLYYQTTGYKMSKHFRFPEGRYSRDKLELCSKNGYNTFFWSIAYADWDNSRQPNENQAIKELLKQTHPGAVILLHPTSETNTKILDTMIKQWKSMGYRFASLDELVDKNK